MANNVEHWYTQTKPATGERVFHRRQIRLTKARSWGQRSTSCTLPKMCDDTALTPTCTEEYADENIFARCQSWVGHLASDRGPDLGQKPPGYEMSHDKIYLYYTFIWKIAIHTAHSIVLWPNLIIRYFKHVYLQYLIKTFVSAYMWYWNWYHTWSITGVL